jgi:hypothetical protein
VNGTTTGGFMFWLLVIPLVYTSLLETAKPVGYCRFRCVTAPL